MMCINNAHKVIVVLPRNGTNQGAQNESSAIFSKLDVGSESIRRDNPPGLFEHISNFCELRVNELLVEETFRGD